MAACQALQVARRPSAHNANLTDLQGPDRSNPVKHPGNLESRLTVGAAESVLFHSELSADDVEDVFNLFQRVFPTVPFGALRERSKDEFRRILSDQEKSLSVGTWLDGELIAYTLADLASGSVESEAPVFRLVGDLQEPFTVNQGALVAPEFKGKRILAAMMRERKRLAIAKGFLHSKSLISEMSLAVLGHTLRQKRWMVGFERDEYCQNYVCYMGRLCKDLNLAERKAIPLKDIETIRGYLDAGWVGVDIETGTSSDEPDVVLRRCEELSDFVIAERTPR